MIVNSRSRLAFGSLALVVGVGIHMGALALAERIVPSFPRVTDVLAERLPAVDFGVWGELAFASLIIWFALVFFRQPERDLPRLLVSPLKSVATPAARALLIARCTEPSPQLYAASASCQSPNMP